MSTRVVDTITREGFTSVVREDADGRVYFTADADIDADGANGQNGTKAAYVVGDKGSEFMANGGLTRSGKIANSWARDIFILGPDGQPKVFPGGVVASKTWYRYPGKKADDPAAYVDSETVPYIVVPPNIVRGVKGVVRGCKARVTLNGKSADAAVLDLGPRNKVGELSIAAARALGLPSSPRNGGTEKPIILYELWPGVAAPGFELQPA